MDKNKIVREPIKPDICEGEAAEMVGLTRERFISGHIRRGLVDAVRVKGGYRLSSAQIKMYVKARQNKETRLDWLKVRRDLKLENVVLWDPKLGVTE